MIGRLKGTVAGFGEDYLLLDVGGVGYEVHCPTRVLTALPPAGEAVTLAIETVVREDAIRLYGFGDSGEREWFRLLQSVQGVGGRVALAVLGILAPAQLASAIALGDAAAVARAPGVGKRIAERICAELKDKAPAFSGGDPAVMRAAADAAAARASGPAADAVSALVNLGYGEPQALVAVAAAGRALGAEAAADALIRQALKALARPV